MLCPLHLTHHSTFTFPYSFILFCLAGIVTVRHPEHCAMQFCYWSTMPLSLFDSWAPSSPPKCLLPLTITLYIYGLGKSVSFQYLQNHSVCDAMYFGFRSHIYKIQIHSTQFQTLLLYVRLTLGVLLAYTWLPSQKYGKSKSEQLLCAMDPSSLLLLIVRFIHWQNQALDVMPFPLRSHQQYQSIH